jgi:hypothetical protein
MLAAAFGPAAPRPAQAGRVAQPGVGNSTLEAGGLFPNEECGLISL